MSCKINTDFGKLKFCILNSDIHTKRLAVLICVIYTQPNWRIHFHFVEVVLQVKVKKAVATVPVIQATTHAALMVQDG